MPDETVSEQAPEEVGQAETDTTAEADATRAEIAAQGTEEATEEEQPVAADAEPTTEPDAEEKPGDEEEKPVRKRTSGYSRLKARNQATIAENEQLRRQLAEAKSTEEDKPPTLEEFDGDYDAHQRALTTHETGKVVREELSKSQKADAERRERETVQVAEDEFMERLDGAREKFSDFDTTLQNLQTHVGQLNPDLVNLIQESDQGEMILYHLGKNLNKATRLNGAGIIAAAKEIGNLEATLSVPKTKKTSNAPPPVAPVKGGTTPPPTDIEKIAAGTDMKAYIAAREAMTG